MPILLYWNLEILSQNILWKVSTSGEIILYYYTIIFYYLNKGLSLQESFPLLCTAEHICSQIRATIRKISWTQLIYFCRSDPSLHMHHTIMKDLCKQSMSPLFDDTPIRSCKSEDKIKQNNDANASLCKCFLVFLGEQASNIWLNRFNIRTCCFTVNKVILKSDPDRGGELQLTAGGTIGWT